MEKKKILILLLALILIFPVYSFSREKDEIDELRREITLVNLINGLSLTDQQAKEIIKYAEEAKTIRESVEKEYESKKLELKTALTELRDNLYDKNLKPPQEVERHASELNHEALKMKEETIKQLREIEEKVKSVLTPGQIEIVQNFKPCLIPPKDLKNPERAGQAFDSSPAEKLLERARLIPDSRYETARYRIADEYIKKIELHIGEMSNSEKEAKTKILLETIEMARQMSDEEFALNKSDLALKIRPDKEIDRLALKKSRKDLSSLGRFLLDEKVIPILQKRLEASESQQGYTGSSGLSYINNKGNSCAIKTL